MTKREAILTYLLYNLEEYLYNNDSELVDHICLHKCKGNTIDCPRGGAKHTKPDCIQCIGEFLDKEIPVEATFWYMMKH